MARRVVKGNTAIWSPEFAAKQSLGRSEGPGRPDSGDEGSLDPAELEVIEEGNRADGRQAPSPSMFRSAKVNGKEVRKQTRPLSAGGLVDGLDRPGTRAAQD